MSAQNLIYMIPIFTVSHVSYTGRNEYRYHLRTVHFMALKTVPRRKIVLSLILMIVIYIVERVIIHTLTKENRFTTVDMDTEWHLPNLPIEKRV